MGKEKVMMYVLGDMHIPREEVKIETLIKQLEALKEAEATHVDFNFCFAVGSEGAQIIEKTINLNAYREIEVDSKDLFKPSEDSIEILRHQIAKLQAAELMYTVIKGVDDGEEKAESTLVKEEIPETPIENVDRKAVKLSDM